MTKQTPNNKKRIGVRNTRNIISLIFLSLVAIAALCFCVVLLIQNANLEKEREEVNRGSDHNDLNASSAAHRAAELFL